MGESKYVEECGREFKSKHPGKDGWIVFRIEPDSYGTYTCWLPAFLIAEAAGAVTRQDISFDVAWSNGRKRTSLSELPLKRRGKGMHEDDWLGEIELVWQEVPIHYARYPVQDRYRDTESTWIATKNRAALENLWGMLVKFRRRNSNSRSEINITNGGSIQKPRLSWGDLILPGGMADEIRSNAESFLAAKAHYKAMKLPYRRGFLFAGPPGVGKTFAAKVIYSKLKTSAHTLDLKSDVEDKDLKNAFLAAADAAPAVLLLEDLDRLVRSPKLSMSFLLNLLDGMEPTEGVIVIATTNSPEKLDAALLQRPSRFDRVWHFPLPGLAERIKLLSSRAGGKFSEECLQHAAERTSGFTMAYTQEAVVSALLTAVYEKRNPRDSDLVASVEELARQLREGRKKDGAIKIEEQVGFAVMSNG